MLLYSWVVLFDFYHLMSISTDYYVHVLLDSFSPQYSPYSKNNSSVNLIYQTTKIWQCNVVLSAQLFLLQPGKHGTVGISYAAGYVPIPQRDFDYIWHDTSHDHPKTITKISTFYLYTLTCCGSTEMSYYISYPLEEIYIPKFVII